jgi:hypothetical protein
MRAVTFLLSLAVALSTIPGCAEKAKIVASEKAQPEPESRLQMENGTLALVPLVPTKPAEEEQEECVPWYNSWVFWTLVGAVAVGATTGVVLALEDTTSESKPFDYTITFE